MRTKREQDVGDLIEGPWNVFESGPKRPEVSREQVELLAKEIAEQLMAGHGSVTRRTASVGDVDLWRKAARRAGRIMAVPVRTGVADDGSKVWVVDES